MKLSNRRIIESMLLGDSGQSAKELFDRHDLVEIRRLRKQRTTFSDNQRSKGRVYILPGILGSTLWGDREFLPDDWIWISPLDLARGAIRKLKIGAEPNPVFAKDAVDLVYLKLKLSLIVAGYDADYLPYDWRYSPNEVGATLLDHIKSRGEKDVSLVCHSMGGLLARQMASLDPEKKYIKQVVTLGTPNYGSYSPIEIFALTDSTLQVLAKIDIVHTEEEIVDKYVKYFRGLLEMMPDSRLRPNEDYYNLSRWPASGLKPAKQALIEAKQAKRSLPPVDDRFVQIVGTNEETIQSATVKDDEFHFEMNNDGDGTVPRDLAEMGEIDRYYIDAKHRRLPLISKAVKGVIDILETGKTRRLRTSPVKRGDSISNMRSTDANKLRKSKDRKPVSGIEKILDGVFDELPSV